MISVVIPLYNKEASIAHTLDCVLTQTYQNFEIVVVDDGSKDNSANIVETFTDPRIRLIRQPNGGVSAARNKGIEEAKGDYIAFLDADDEWQIRHLEDMSNLINKYTQCHAFATCYKNRIGDKESLIILNKLPFDGEDGILNNYFEVSSCSHPPVWSSAVCVERKLLLEIGGFPVGIKSGEDLLTWAKIAVRTNFAYCLTPSATYCIGDVSAVPRRKHIEEDPVGDQLRELYKEYQHTLGIKGYLSRWYKIRSMCFLQEGKRRLVWKTAFESLRYKPLDYKLYMFIILAFFPQNLTKELLTRYTR